MEVAERFAGVHHDGLLLADGSVVGPTVVAQRSLPALRGLRIVLVVVTGRQGEVGALGGYVKGFGKALVGSGGFRSTLNCVFGECLNVESAL